MSTLDRPARPLATGLTLVVLVAVVGGLIALVLRPGSASLWPAAAGGTHALHL